MVQRTSNAIRLDNEGKTVNKSTSGSTTSGSKSSSSSSGSKSSSSSGTSSVVFTDPGAVSTSSRTTTPAVSQTKTVSISSPKTINSSSGGTSATNAYMQNGARNAGVDSAAINKQAYTPEDAKTYANRETAYNFLDKTTGKINTVYSNYTNYKDAAREAGYNLEDEGKTWRMDNATTYGIAGSSGRGTTYGASSGGYNSDNPASGGWYGEAMRRVNNAQNQYGGLDKIVNTNDEAYKAYMQGNYLPIYGQDPNSIDWNGVANGTTAQAYWDAGTPMTGYENAYETPAYEMPTYEAYNPNSYFETLMSGLAYTPQELSYQAPTGGITDTILDNADKITASAAYNYVPVDAAKWNYDVPETVRMQNAGYQMTPAAEAYSGMLESANTDADIAMAKYWSDIAASAMSENDRQYALRQALRYRNKIA